MFANSFFKKIAIALLLFICAEGQANRNKAFCDLDSSPSRYPKPEYNCYNQLSIPKNLPNPEKIKTLGVWSGSNILETLKTGELLAAKTVNLQVLDLTYCKLKSIEKGAFNGGSSLIELLLSFNLIEELDLSVFEDLPNLQRLKLYNNPLKTFSSVFPNVNLVHLDISQCKLRSISSTIFQKLQKLEELILHANQFTTIDWKVFHSLKNLRKVSLYDNPFHCDCQVKLLLNFFTKQNITWAVSLKIPKCSSSLKTDSFQFLPDEIIGKPWDLINPQFLFCPPEVTSLQIRENLQRINYLECEYSGHPEPIVMWRINGKPLLIDENNKHLIQTKALGDFRFSQTLFTFLLPISVNNVEAPFTCQAYNFLGNSTVRNAVSTAIQTNNSDSYGIKTVAILVLASVTVIIVVIAAVFYSQRNEGMLEEFYKKLPCAGGATRTGANVAELSNPQLPDNPEDHMYDYVSVSWNLEQDSSGYEIPLSASADTDFITET